jgi:hypothetical protein
MSHLPTIEVTAPEGATLGRLRFGDDEFACALGRAGIVIVKREGDGGTPAGTFPLREMRYRADRIAAPESSLITIATAPDDGWCDAPHDPAYNRFVKRLKRFGARIISTTSSSCWAITTRLSYPARAVRFSSISQRARKVLSSPQRAASPCLWKTCAAC